VIQDLVGSRKQVCRSQVREKSFYSFSRIEFAVVIQINEVAFLL
jgi:hypothetical protein